MDKYICPRCGTCLRENDWDMIHEMSDGSFIMDAHPICKCPDEKCGYMKRSEPVPEIIAQQGDDRLFLLYQNDRGPKPLPFCR